ncbi:MAG: hypothetical protein AAFN11_19820 [Chloroflexota bacterium]
MELQDALNFTNADLEANQIGKLSPTQREALKKRRLRSWQMLRNLASAIILMVIGAVLFSGITSIFLGTTALILTVMGFAEYLVGYRTYAVDLQSPHIETIQGVLYYMQRRESVMGIENHPVGISVGGEKFLLVEDQVRAFEEGEIYALHIAPATHTLLSAERIYLDEKPKRDVIITYDELLPKAYQQKS